MRNMMMKFWTMEIIEIICFWMCERGKMMEAESNGVEINDGGGRSANGIERHFFIRTCLRSFFYQVFLFWASLPLKDDFQLKKVTFLTDIKELFLMIFWFLRYYFIIIIYWILKTQDDENEFPKNLFSYHSKPNYL